MSKTLKQIKSNEIMNILFELLFFFHTNHVANEYLCISHVGAY